MRKTIAKVEKYGDPVVDDVLEKIGQQFERLEPEQLLNFLAGTLIESCRVNNISRTDLFAKLNYIADFLYRRDAENPN